MYNSSSDSEELEELTDQNTSYVDDHENIKKRKVSLSLTKIEHGRDIFREENITQPEGKRFKSLRESPNGSVMRNSCSESEETNKSSRCDHNGLLNDFEESLSPLTSRSNEMKSQQTVCLMPECKQPKFSVSPGMGGCVKPYIPKREREKIIQPSASRASTFPMKPRVELADLDCISKDVNAETNSEMLCRKNPDYISRPPKQLHLSLEGHSQGVNCIRWNPTQSNLLLTAAMDHVVCIWDTSGGGTCSKRLTDHTGAVKDSKWSLCGSQVLSCGYDKTVRLFNLETGNI